eukprot:TRINITY_DN20277_c0_g1_i1.p1 TRINITY_DN20277_c0_g1~~TRINITY_DN20277_c0_g1_i1.p1  ORF type:complete len:221 (-),score=38.34 TRINITY_DN20277_c0_g1_i1:57-719(-)
MRVGVEEKQEEKELGFMDELCQAEEQPTKVTYNTLINVCATRADMFDHAVEWFNRMEAEGLTRDDHSYRAMQRACAIAGEVEYMDKVLEEANQAQFSRDVHSYALEANTYAVCNHLRGRYDHQFTELCISRTISLLDRMTQAKVQPDYATLIAVLKVYVGTPRPNRALAVLKDPRWATQVKGWPDLHACDLVLRSMCAVKHIDNALHLSLIHISEPTRPY